MKLTLLFTSLFIALSAAAQHQNRLIMQANNQYRQKQYDQAARSYDEILAFDSTSKIVRFNRANAGFRLGHMGAFRAADHCARLLHRAALHAAHSRPQRA